MKIERYPSSLDENLELYAEFYIPDAPRPLAVFFHGWHMRAEQSRPSVEKLVAAGYFVVNVDMRGRDRCSGKPDAGGLELVDGLDALDYARRTWPDRVDDTRGPYVVGGSGGGANTMTIVGKAPDRFAAAVSWAGMSDYAVWYEDDARGRYRDEMTDKGWIGGTPATNPEAYQSRAGITTLDNLLTPLLLIHGRKDASVPVHHATNYKARADKLARNVSLILNDTGHDSIEWPEALAFLEAHTSPPQLPRNGGLVLASFVATRAFRLVADSPDVMGKLTYELDEAGRLSALSFSRNGFAAPLKKMMLDIPLAGAKGARVEVSPAGTILTPVAPGPMNFERYEIAGACPWRLEISYNESRGLKP